MKSHNNETKYSSIVTKAIPLSNKVIYNPASKELFMLYTNPMCTDHILNDFCQQLSAIDFCDVALTVFPEQGLGYTSGSEQYRMKRTYKIFKRYPTLSTCSDKKAFLKAIINLCSNYSVTIEDQFLYGQYPKGFFYGPYEKVTPKFQSERESLFNKYNVQSEASYVVKFNQDNFIGHFQFLSHLPLQQLLINLQKPGIKNLLKLTYYYLTRNYPSLLNPKRHNGQIGNRSFQVLELTAFGYNAATIAQQVNLTERSVVYHIERLKELLEAKNKADLIRIAKEQCLI